MFSTRKKGSSPRVGVGADVGMDVGMGMDVGRCIDGGAKWPENQWVTAIGDSE